MWLQVPLRAGPAAAALLLLLAATQLAAPAQAVSCDTQLQAVYKQCLAQAATKCGSTCCASYASPQSATSACMTELDENVYSPCIVYIVDSFDSVALVALSSTSNKCYYPTSQTTNTKDQVCSHV